MKGMSSPSPISTEQVDALRPAYQELVDALPRQPYVRGDETPNKEGSGKAWLWTFVAASFTVFTNRGSRSDRRRAVP